MSKPLLTELPIPGDIATRQRRVCAVIFLAGGAGTRAFSQQVRRPLLQMPISASETVLGMWHSQIRRLSEHAGFHGISVIIAGGEPPQTTEHWDSPRVSHLNDPQELRGTGGVLHDLTAGYPADAHVLVANAASLLMAPLETVVGELIACDADAVLCADESAVPDALMLLRTCCLRAIAPVGFVDFKEQAMPGIVASNSVAVLRRHALATASLRTPSSYIAALRRFHAMQLSLGAKDATLSASAFIEQWKPLFSIVEPGADVAPDARIHDSVILAGAHVARGATVVRSVVCSGARVPPGATLVDQVASSEKDDGKMKERSQSPNPNGRYLRQMTTHNKPPATYKQ